VVVPLPPKAQLSEREEPRQSVGTRGLDGQGFLTAVGLANSSQFHARPTGAGRDLPLATDCFAAGCPHL
jgi:hypothetical protein